MLVTIGRVTEIASLVASLLRVQGLERHSLAQTLERAFNAMFRARDVDAVKGYLDAVEPLGMTPPLVPGTMEQRRAFVTTFAPRLESASAAMRDWVAHYLLWTALDGVDLAEWATPLLRTSADAEIPPRARTPLAKIGRRALGAALGSTKHRDVFLAAAKVVDGDLDATQRKAFRKHLEQVFPEALDALGGKAPRSRRPENEPKLLAAVHASLDDDGRRLVYADALLATVEEIRVKRGAFFRDDNAIVSDPVMQSLRTLTGIPCVSFLAIERDDLEHVGIVHFQVNDETLAALVRQARLRRLDIDGSIDPASLGTWATDNHPSMRTITMDRWRIDRDGNTWRESK